MELGLMIPQSGGQYIYLYTALGDYPAFLWSWTTNLVTKSGSFAMIAIAFAEYALAPFYPSCSIPNNLVKITAAACIGK